MSDLYKRFVPGYDALTTNAVAAGAGGAPPNGPFKPGEVPLLTPDLLKELRAQLANEPELTLQLAQRAFDRNMTANDLARLLNDLDSAFKDPDVVIAAADLTASTGPQLPPEFQFAGMEAGPMYQHQPNDNKYEDSDKWGYGLNGAAAIIKRVFIDARAPFRWHDEFPSQFRYTLPDNARVALFSDFGTGQAHTWYIAKFLTANKPTVAIHLGDTYYAGRSNEDEVNFQLPLSALVTGNPGTSTNISQELWVIAGNHDYYSGGHAFFGGIDGRRSGTKGTITFKPHRQVGSYFCLESTKFRIIAIDVEYHSFFGLNPKYKETRLKDWLKHHVTEAKAKGQSVLLMSTDEPYSICDPKLTDVYHDVTDDLEPDAIDLWFWGNTHYCAIFDHSERLRSKFYGSCIGHGGFPYSTQNTLHPSPYTDAAPYRWAETEPRFPKWTGVRPDMGNNGFVMMDLDDANQTVKLEYFDWTNTLRATAKFTKQGNQLVHTMIAGQARPPMRAGT